jgi:hypothetical protein
MLEGIYENALWTARQKPLKTCFAKMERQLPEIVVTFNQDVEGAELHLLVMLAGMQSVEEDDSRIPLAG